ncbi:hypothetical protein D3C87_1456140 [compost metagenome]
MIDTQVCPEFRNLPAIAPFTAASISASSNTINGALPPSSIDTFLMLEAACVMSVFPTSVEPVNDNFLIIGLLASSFPNPALSLLVTTLKTPFGIPASSANFARAIAENGVCEAGFRIMVQPAASAGATFRVIMAKGKFQGVIAATTPIPCLIVISLFPF